MHFLNLLLALPAALVAAAPATENISRQVASGCYALSVLPRRLDFLLFT